MIKDILILTIFPGAMDLSAVSDFFTMTIPNRLVRALAFAFAIFFFGWIGGGDAKLFAATCLWIDPESIAAYGIYVALFGGALTLLLLIWRCMPLPSMLPPQGWLIRLHSPKEGVPYGIALAAAGLLVYRETPFVAALGG